MKTYLKLSGLLAINSVMWFYAGKSWCAKNHPNIEAEASEIRGYYEEKLDRLKAKLDEVKVDNAAEALMAYQGGVSTEPSPKAAYHRPTSAAEKKLEGPTVNSKALAVVEPVAMVITEDEAFQSEARLYQLTYYIGDDTLLNEQSVAIPKQSRAQYFGYILDKHEFDATKEAVYILNRSLNSVYEITLEPGAFYVKDGNG